MRTIINKTAPLQHPAAQAENGDQRLPGMLEVNVTSGKELDHALEEAIAVVKETAAYHRIGVLITRTGVGSYIVRAHPAVPYGLIRQQHE